MKLKLEMDSKTEMEHQSRLTEADVMLTSTPKSIHHRETARMKIKKKKPKLGNMLTPAT